MDRAAAIKAMKNGHKITHTYFCSNEWIKMYGFHIVCEGGYLHEPSEFWRYRKGVAFDKGWEIYGGNK